MKLKNKIAIITGGAGGIGQEIAQAYLAEGATVVIAGRSVDELKKAEKSLNSPSLSTIKCDVSKDNDVAELAKSTLDQHGRIDILVNAAGIYGPIGSSLTVDIDAWLKTFEVNLFGTFRVIRAVAPHMIEVGSGKIINFSGGGDGPMPNFTGYNTSKVAVVRLTESLAKEFGDLIDINAIAPGAVNTRLLDESLEAGVEAVGKEKYDALLKQKADGGTPPEVPAKLCVFLASAESNGLSGKFISAVWDKWTEFPTEIDQLMSGDRLTIRRIK